MSKNDKRFMKVHEEGGGFGTALTVYVDKRTGVNYLFAHAGYAGGLCPLLDREGKPVISPVHAEHEYL